MKPETSEHSTAPRWARWLVVTEPQLGILAAGQWVSTTGNSLNALALSWLTLSLTGSRAALGLVSGAGDAAGLLIILSGVLVDRWNRRRTMLTADVARGVLAASLGVLAAMGRLDLAGLIALVIASRLMGTLFSPASFGILPQLVGRARLARANALMATARTSAELAGQLVGGVLLSLLGPVGLFLLNGASFGVSATSLAVLKPTPDPERAVQAPSVRAMFGELADGQRLIWRDPFLRRLVPVGMVMGFASVAISVLDVAWVRQILHASAVIYGLFWVAAGVGGIVGSAVSGSLLERVALVPINIVSLVVAGLAIAVLGQVPSAPFDLALMGVLGLSIGVQSTSLNTAIMLLVPEDTIGRSIGAIGALTGAAGPLGAVVSGLAATVWPLRWVLAGSGLLMAATALGLLGVTSPPSAHVDRS